MNAGRRWLGDRTERERALLTVAAALLITVSLTWMVLATREHLRGLAARVVARREELAVVRGLAARLQSLAPTAPSGGPTGGTFLARLETAVTNIVGHERLAALTPTNTDDGQTHITVRITDANLSEVVTFLHAVEGTGDGLSRLELRTRPGANRHFDLVAEVTSQEIPS